MPKIDLDAIESHLRAAREEERRVSRASMNLSFAPLLDRAFALSQRVIFREGTENLLSRFHTDFRLLVGALCRVTLGRVCPCSVFEPSSLHSAIDPSSLCCLLDGGATPLYKRPSPAYSRIINETAFVLESPGARLSSSGMYVVDEPRPTERALGRACPSR